MTDFETRNRLMIQRMVSDSALHELSRQWFVRSSEFEYSYHFSWLGRPIIQFPQDIIALQEIVWTVKPEIVIETGIARGGSLIFYASILELLGGDRRVVGIDVEIRSHNRVEIERHPLSNRITMIEGSSTDEEVVREIHELASGRRPVMVVLDSNHTHEHVLRELELYSPLVSSGSYLVVLDTVIEDLPEHFFADRPWGKGNNPKTAVQEFLRTNDKFVNDAEFESKLLITVAPGGYLKCVRD